MEVIREPWLTTHPEDEGKLLEFCVPFPYLIVVRGLGCFPRQTFDEIIKGHEDESRSDEWNEEADPSSEQGGAQVLVQLVVILVQDQNLERLEGQDCGCFRFTFPGDNKLVHIPYPETTKKTATLKCPPLKNSLMTGKHAK